MTVKASHRTIDERAFDVLYEKSSDALGNAVEGEHVDTVRVLLRRGAKVKLDHCVKANKEVFRLLRRKLGFHTVAFCLREFLGGNWKAFLKYWI